MGLLRLLLALSVIESHTRPLFASAMIPGGYAVETFFIISGFYMALILNQKYLKLARPYPLFITNRILRLYPLYLIVLILSLLIYLPFDHTAPENPWHYCLNSAISWPMLLFLVFSNLFAIGLDIPYFLNTQLKFPDYCQVIPQAWSLSLEFYFYCMAPFLVRAKTKYLLALFLISIGIRIYLASHGLYRDPWSFRFFPTELALFVLGIFSYKIYLRLLSFKIAKFIPGLLLLLVLYPIIYWSDCSHHLRTILPVVAWPKEYPSFLILYFLSLAAALPFIFKFTKDLSWDRWLGELSYPIYLVHTSIIYLLNALKLTSINSVFYGWITVITCIAVSLGLLYFVIYPVERLRQHRVLSHKM